jgi:hypothetical protein
MCCGSRPRGQPAFPIDRLQPEKIERRQGEDDHKSLNVSSAHFVCNPRRQSCVEAKPTHSVRKPPMKINLTLIALSVALILGLPHPAESRSLNGAAIGTPGAENKGNPIPVHKGSHTHVHRGISANATTPGEESKGNRKGRPLTSY